LLGRRRGAFALVRHSISLHRRGDAQARRNAIMRRVPPGTDSKESSQ